jgi:hypothetical protein
MQRHLNLQERTCRRFRPKCQLGVPDSLKRIPEVRRTRAETWSQFWSQTPRHYVSQRDTGHACDVGETPGNTNRVILGDTRRHRTSRSRMSAETPPDNASTMTIARSNCCSSSIRGEIKSIRLPQPILCWQCRSGCALQAAYGYAKAQSNQRAVSKAKRSAAVTSSGGAIHNEGARGLDGVIANAMRNRKSASRLVTSGGGFVLLFPHGPEQVQRGSPDSLLHTDSGERLEPAADWPPKLHARKQPDGPRPLLAQIVRP